MFDKLLGRELEPPYAPGPWRLEGLEDLDLKMLGRQAPHGSEASSWLLQGYNSTLRIVYVICQEQFELFEHPCAKGQGPSPEVVKQNGFFCSVFRRNR